MPRRRTSGVREPGLTYPNPKSSLKGLRGKAIYFTGSIPYLVEHLIQLVPKGIEAQDLEVSPPKSYSDPETAFVVVGYDFFEKRKMERYVKEMGDSVAFLPQEFFINLFFQSYEQYSSAWQNQLFSSGLSSQPEGYDLIDLYKQFHLGLQYVKELSDQYEFEWPNASSAMNITEHLGGGTYGNVYRASELTTGLGPVYGDVAVKIIKPEFAKVVHEEAYAARISHPNIVPMYDVQQLSALANPKLPPELHQAITCRKPGPHPLTECTQAPAPRLINPESIWYIVMEHCTGGNLRTLAEKGVSTSKAVSIVVEILEGLSALHEHEPPFIHRDIKYENILLDSKGIVKIADFGGGKELRDTIARTVAGTPGWQAPEVALRPYEEYDLTADVFSVGLVLYGLITKEKPEYLGKAALVPTWDPGKELPRDLTPHLRKVLVKSLQRDPQQRYLTAADMKEALRKRAVRAVSRRASKEWRGVFEAEFLFHETHGDVVQYRCKWDASSLSSLLTKPVFRYYAPKSYLEGIFGTQWPKVLVVEIGRADTIEWDKTDPSFWEYRYSTGEEQPGSSWLYDSGPDYKLYVPHEIMEGKQPPNRLLLQVTSQPSGGLLRYI